MPRTLIFWLTIFIAAAIVALIVLSSKPASAAVDIPEGFVVVVSTYDTPEGTLMMYDLGAVVMVRDEQCVLVPKRAMFSHPPNGDTYMASNVIAMTGAQQILSLRLRDNLVDLTEQQLLLVSDDAIDTRPCPVGEAEQPQVGQMFTASILLVFSDKPIEVIGSVTMKAVGVEQVNVEVIGEDIQAELTLYELQNLTPISSGGVVQNGFILNSNGQVIGLLLIHRDGRMFFLPLTI